jgi:hypothetical protein
VSQYPIAIVVIIVAGFGQDWSMTTRRRRMVVAVAEYVVALVV